MKSFLTQLFLGAVAPLGLFVYHNNSKTIYKLNPAISTAYNTSSDDDADNDGLHDYFETHNVHLKSIPGHNIKPTHADLIMVYTLRPGTNEAVANREMMRVKQFFANLDVPNPDGIKGINLVWIKGNPLTEADKETDYRLLYEKSVPAVWRPYAHGILIEPMENLGGQKHNSKWCAASNNWKTIVHEIGHQLGLEHHPKGSPSPSPLYTSLMNYDYNYSFNGDPEKVHFSNGRFASLRLNEWHLYENIPFPINQLEFLNKAPYNYKLKSISPTATAIDWNRNGIFSESDIQASINDGNAFNIGNGFKIGKSAGAPVVTADHNGKIVVIYPGFTNENLFDKWKMDHPSNVKPVELFIKPVDPVRKTAGSAYKLASVAHGDASALFMNNRLYVTYPLWWGNQGAVVVQEHDKNAPYSLLSTKTVTIKGKEQLAVSPQLAFVNYRPTLICWLRKDSTIYYANIDFSSGKIKIEEPGLLRSGPAATSLPVKSLAPPAVCTDRASGTTYIIFLTSTHNKFLFGKARLEQYPPASSFFCSNFDYLKPDNDDNLSTPVKIAAHSDYGLVRIFYKRVLPRDVEWPGNIHTLIQYKNERRNNLVSNIWTETVSSPGLYVTGDNVYLALRWYSNDELKKDNNDLLFFPSASGMETTYPADFDDLSYIRNRGLKESLR